MYVLVCLTNVFISLHKLKQQIVLSKRFEKDNGSVCKLSVDGTHFRIQEPTPFSPMWFSHKDKKPALKYEVALCIQTGHIVWTHGPFPGSYHDVVIFRFGLKAALAPGERCEADKGYRGEFHTIDLPDECCTGNSLQKYSKSIVRARQETVNRRYKQFGCLKQVYRHGLYKHCSIFHAVTVIIQINIECGNELFHVNYKTIDEK